MTALGLSPEALDRRRGRRLSIAETFEAKHIPEPNSGCWLWIGKINKQGYGVISRQTQGQKRILRAHMVAYNLTVGLVPAGLELDHKCRMRSCVNPTHLEAVTHQENCRRGGIHKRKSHCIHGHSLDDPTNIYIDPKLGSRRCRTCYLQKSRDQDAKRRAARAQA